MERKGIHIDGDPNTKHDMCQTAIRIAGMLKEREKVETFREKLIGQELDWNDISKEWIKKLEIK